MLINTILTINCFSSELFLVAVVSVLLFEMAGNVDCAIQISEIRDGSALSFVNSVYLLCWLYYFPFALKACGHANLITGGEGDFIALAITQN